jgi:phosphoglycerate dehydrogenase-like enzyme
MRIHVQNAPDGSMFGFTPEQWEAAVARAGSIGEGHEVSFGETKQEFDAAIGQAEALVAVTGAVRRCFPADAPRLKIVFLSAAGLEFLAPFDWLPPGCALLNNRGTHAAKSGEFALMALLMLANRVPTFVTAQRAGTWRKAWGHVLRGRRVTIVGLGTLGASAAAHAARFGMHVTGVRTRAGTHPDCTEVIETGDIDRVLPTSDYLLLACPLTDATRNLMNADRLALLPPHAGIVNMGRGALLDQDALCDRLDAGLLDGAVLDVFTPEPIPEGHRLWTTKNLIISPHTSADDPDTYNPMSLDLFFDNLRAAQEGRPMPNRYDIARGY